MPSAEERAALLSLVARDLATDDYESGVRAAIGRLVPALGDWVTVSVVDEDGNFRRIAVLHSDPGRKSWTERYERGFPPASHRDQGYGAVIRDGRSHLVEHVSEAVLSAAA